MNDKPVFVPLEYCSIKRASEMLNIQPHDIKMFMLNKQISIYIMLEYLPMKLRLLDGLDFDIPDEKIESFQESLFHHFHLLAERKGDLKCRFTPFDFSADRKQGDSSSLPFNVTINGEGMGVWEVKNGGVFTYTGEQGNTEISDLTLGIDNKLSKEDLPLSLHHVFERNYTGDAQERALSILNSMHWSCKIDRERCDDYEDEFTEDDILIKKDDLKAMYDAIYNQKELPVKDDGFYDNSNASEALRAIVEGERRTSKVDRALSALLYTKLYPESLPDTNRAFERDIHRELKSIGYERAISTDTLKKRFENNELIERYKESK